MPLPPAQGTPPLYKLCVPRLRMPPLGLIIQIYFLRIVLYLNILIYNINIVTGKVNGTVSVISMLRWQYPIYNGTLIFV